MEVGGLALGVGGLPGCATVVPAECPWLPSTLGCWMDPSEAETAGTQTFACVGVAISASTNELIVEVFSRKSSYVR